MRCNLTLYTGEKSVSRFSLARAVLRCQPCAHEVPFHPARLGIQRGCGCVVYEKAEREVWK